ncbi:ABC transporter permease [Mesoterricola sediminis]|uniref:Multidrug ABC transporter permease n=1 Tax=Mesoterricola sediminis TaxID=2927980 RepID=A0AA48H261_9BACT|nr:FtsX-like permease family protein [Mesoterricola sediminis]BDU78257.1 multidrug ABC transporter permease [Mesoterricola sediminis]
MIGWLFVPLAPYLLWLLHAALFHPVPLAYNWRSIWVRKAGTLSTVGAIAIVVMIFVVVLSMAQGVSRAYVRSGRDDQVIILRQNARVEMMSSVTLAQARLIATHPLIARDAQGPLLTEDIIVSKQLPLADGSGSLTVTVRGTTRAGARMRSQVTLVAGRWFRPGLSEAVVPRRMQNRYAGVDLGGTIAMGGRTWTVVGVFDGSGSVYDSEVWTDVADLRQAYRRYGVDSSVAVRLRSAEDVPAFVRDMERDVRLKLEAKPEPAYFADLGDAGRPMQVLGQIITAILTVGAIFAAMNTMYAAVAGRTSEIGTLRAIGFKRREILASFQWEAILLTALGGLLGASLALLFNGTRSGGVNMTTWSDVSYAFAITPGLMAQGVAFSILMGLAGGFLPAWRASRIPVTEAMRG